MPKLLGSTCAAVSLGAVVAGCQTAPAHYANTGIHATYSVAQTGVGAVRATGGELYVGAGDAVRKPLHDLNMMQDKIAPVLLRAESHPYDLTGVNSCNDVLDRVSELDLALGPDVDAPKQRHKARVMRGADFAASAALDAAGSAAEHFLPMRSTIKQITGATRYENHVKHAQLAGTTRRSFLKAIGMEHSCSWPAAPLDYTPVQVADVDARWSAVVVTSPVQTGGAPILLASARPASAAAVTSVAAVASSPNLQVAVLTSPKAGVAPSAHRASVVQSGKTQPLGASATSVPAAARVVLVSTSLDARNRGGVFVPVHERLAIPTATPPAQEPSQGWSPASSEARVVEVSTPISDPVSSTKTEIGAGAPAPWSTATAFTGNAARP